MIKKSFIRKYISLHTILVFTFLYLPIIVLVIFSFNREKINAIWTGFTLKWYESVLHNTYLLSSVEKSFIVAIISTILATVIGTLIAFGMDRFPFPGKKIFDSILYMPIIIPDIVQAIAMLSFYVLIKITLGLTTIILSHTTFNIAFVAIIVRARLTGFDRSLEDASMDLGATPVQTFRYITLPLILPGVISGALLAFILSWDDFVIAFFTSGVGSTTLPLKVYSMVKFGVTPEINVISTITIIISLLLFFLSIRIGRMYNLK